MRLTHAHIQAELDRINEQETELQLRRILLWALDQRLYDTQKGRQR